MTTNITLDTSFIVSQNFLHGTLIKEYGKTSKEGKIKLFITDITYREILSQFSQNLIKAEESIKKPKAILETQAKIFRNFVHLSNYFTLPEIDIKKLSDEFKEKFDSFIQTNNITILDTNELNIGKVFEDYFTGNPPFGTGDKKSEFPDAFSTLATEQYFQSKSETTYLITSDHGIHMIKSSTLIISNDPAKVLDSLIRLIKELETKQTIQFIEKLLEQKKDIIKTQINEQIYRIIENEVYSGGGRYDLEIEDVDYIDLVGIEINKHSIIHIDKSIAKIELEVSFDADVKVSASDLNSGFYDKEDSKWFFVEGKDLEVSKEVHSTVLLIIDHRPAAGREYADFEIDSINEGKDFEILKDA